MGERDPVVRVAQRYAGTPYVWGGESRYGFDCSGFIMVVMRDLGYRALPHSAADVGRFLSICLDIPVLNHLRPARRFIADDFCELLR